MVWREADGSCDALLRFAKPPYIAAVARSVLERTARDLLSSVSPTEAIRRFFYHSNNQQHRAGSFTGQQCGNREDNKDVGCLSLPHSGRVGRGHTLVDALCLSESNHPFNKS